MSGRRFAVLDRDGTIIYERDYLSDPERAELLPGAAEGLRKMREMGLGLIVVSNQSGIGRGYFTDEDALSVNRRLIEMLEAERVKLEGIYYCPHAPDEDCECRKPKPGLVVKAVKKSGFNPADSFYIGDKACDIDLGRAFKGKTILVRTGYGEKHLTSGAAVPDFIADDLMEAADIIENIIGKR